MSTEENKNKNKDLNDLNENIEDNHDAGSNSDHDDEKENSYDESTQNSGVSTTQDDDKQDEEQEEKNEKDQTEKTEVDLKLEKEQNEIKLNKLLNDINYGVILAYIDKFGQHLSIKELSFNNFEANLINSNTVNRKLIEFHINLMKNLNFGKHVKKDKWLYYLSKFVTKYTNKDYSFIEKNGYLNLDIDLKLKIVKDLLETQFDENQKFKQILAEQIADLNSLRSSHLGRDKDGYSYWFYMDNEYTIRLFVELSTDKDGQTWKLVAKDYNELKDLIEKLSNEPLLTKLHNSKRYLEINNKNQEIKEEVKIESETNGLEEANEQEVDLKEELKEEAKEQEVDLKEELKEELNEEIKKKDEKMSADTNTEPEKINEKIKNEVKEVNLEKIEEDEVENKQEKNENEDLADESDIIQPIALRKSTRSSVRKMQEIQQEQAKKLSQPKQSPKKTKSTLKSQTTKKSESKQKSKNTSNNKKTRDFEEDEDQEEDIESENDDEEEADDEFKPKLSNKKSTISSTTSTKNSKKTNKKTNLNLTENGYESGSTISDESEQESACSQCSKVKSKQILILCDGCDSPYHLSCLKPALTEIPDGDWFCPICEHDKLIKSLQEKIKIIDDHNKEIELAKNKLAQRRTNCMADIGAYLDNVFGSSSSNTNSRTKTSKKKNQNEDANIENDDPNQSLDNLRMFRKKAHRSIFDCTNEPLGPRSCRVKSRISYTFDEFDRTINQAVGVNDDDDDDDEELSESRKRREAASTHNLRSTRRRSSRLNEDSDIDKNSEQTDSEASKSSEFKCSIKQKYVSDEDEDDEEEEKDEQESLFEDDDDDDFKPKKKPIKSKKRNLKRKSRRKAKKQRRSKSKYCDDTDEEDVDEDDEEEEEEDMSDESFDDYENERARRSNRNRKPARDTYCELSDSEEENINKRKHKKLNYDESFSENEFSGEDKHLRKSTRNVKNKFFKEDDSSEEEENDDEKDLKSSHRKSESVEKSSKSRIKKPWSEDEEDEDNEEKIKNDKNKKNKTIIKKPWSDDDENDMEDEEKDKSLNESKTEEYSESSQEEDEEKLGSKPKEEDKKSVTEVKEILLNNSVSESNSKSEVKEDKHATENSAIDKKEIAHKAVKVNEIVDENKSNEEISKKISNQIIESNQTKSVQLIQSNGSPSFTFQSQQQIVSQSVPYQIPIQITNQPHFQNLQPFQVPGYVNNYPQQFYPTQTPLYYYYGQNQAQNQLQPQQIQPSIIQPLPQSVQPIQPIILQPQVQSGQLPLQSMVFMNLQSQSILPHFKP